MVSFFFFSLHIPDYKCLTFQLELTPIQDSTSIGDHDSIRVKGHVQKKKANDLNLQHDQEFIHRKMRRTGASENRSSCEDAPHGSAIVNEESMKF